jgi:DNA-binding transcriptional MerR regulator
MLSVGELARAAGLSAKALRHYDHIALLVPAAVTADGYRWYDEGQVAVARTIARLRGLDLPLEAVRAVLGGADEQELAGLLRSHRAVLQARDDRIRRAIHALDHLIDDKRGVTMALNETDPAPDQIADERALATRLFGDTWTLLSKESRTPEEDERMVHTAHASRFHWDNVGDDQNRAVGEWQVSRVYSTLARAEPALFHARRCVDYAQRQGVDDWVAASAHEGLARALAVSGDLESARDARDRALALLESVSDPEDRAIVAGDVETLPIT